MVNDFKKAIVNNTDWDNGDDDDDDDDDNESMRLRCGSSPTPSEAGRALLVSCSSSSDSNTSEIQLDGGQVLSPVRNISFDTALPQNQTSKLVKKHPTGSCFVSSTGWKKVSYQVTNISHKIRTKKRFSLIV